MEKESQKINCDVVSCEYQNADNNRCMLDEIKVSSCSDDEASNKDETACKSFKNSSECEEE